MSTLAVCKDGQIAYTGGLLIAHPQTFILLMESLGVLVGFLYYLISPEGQFN